MNGRTSLFCVAVAAALALFATTAAAASAAAPEYVLKSGTFPLKFTATSGTSELDLTTVEFSDCTADTAVGELTSAKAGNLTITFTGCTTTFFGFPMSCKTPGKAAGEIVTTKLSSELAYNVGKTRVVDVLTGPSGVFMEFERGANTVKVTGSVIGYFPTINTFLHSTELIFKQTLGVQEIKEYIDAGGMKHSGVHLSVSKNGGTPIEGGLGTTETITLEGTREMLIAG